MKYTKLIFFFLLFNTTSFAQKLTDIQVEKYLNELQKQQIITEFGKDAFLKAINNDNKILNQRMANSPLALVGKIPDSLAKSRTAILGFIGVFELLRNVGSAADEMIRIREMSEKMLGEKMLFKPEIDGNVKINNPLTFLSIEQNLKPNKANYIEIANQLKNIKLIDEKVYDELIVWLKKDQIKLVKDFGFFIYAAKQTYFYDNYESLKNTQFKFIDSLQTFNLLSTSKAMILKNSYQPYELKSKVELLSFCENAIILPSVQKNLTRAEIYENLYLEIKEKLLPEFRFTEFKITELSKKNNENNEELAKQIPFTNPFAKNKNNYKLSFKNAERNYTQKADTDFAFIKTLQKSIPTDIDIDSTIIKEYANVLSFLTGFTNKDFQSINDFLTDQASNKRIIVVNNDFNPLLPIKESRKILMLVDSLQNKIFEEKTKENALFGGLFGRKIDFTNQKSYDNILKVIKDLQKIEILPSIQNSEISQKITDLRFEQISLDNIPRNLILNSPETCAKIDLTTNEKKENVLVFKNFINELSRISKGKFSPEKITDNFNKEIQKGNQKERELIVKFSLNGKKYVHRQKLAKAIEKSDSQDMMPGIQMNLDKVFFNSEEWLSIVNQSLEENNIDGVFYKIKSRINFTFHQTIENYIFLDKEQFEFIEKNYPGIFKDPSISTINNGNYQEQVATFSPKLFAEALVREKMLTNEVLKSLPLKTIKEPSEVLAKSKEAIIIDLNELSEKTDSEIYTFILNKLNQSILPETKFSNIKNTKENIDSSNFDYEQFNVSALINRVEYQQILYISIKKLVKSAIDSLKSNTATYFPSIGENQFKIINDYLKDISSPKRLVIVCDYKSPKLAFVLFDSTQAELVAETLPNNYVDFSMYDRKFSKDSIKAILDNLSEIGVINKMNEAEKEAFTLKFRRNFGNDITFLQTLPKIIGQLNIWDFDTFKNIYVGIIDSLKAISHNQFFPTEVADNFAKTLKKGNYTNRIFKYSFNFGNNKKYEESQFVKALEKPKNKKDKINYEVFDFDTNKLLALVNKALNENNTDGMFYQIYSDTDDEESVGPKYIFLTTRQYRWFKVNLPDIFESYEYDRSPSEDTLKEEK